MANLKVAFIGDLVGRPARHLLRDYLSLWRKEGEWDVVIANAENAAAGAGLTASLAEEIHSYGVDLLTLGDHVWDQRSLKDEIASLPFVCRPANLPPACPGLRYTKVSCKGLELAVFTVLGRQFLNLKGDCPFRTAEALVREISKETPYIFAEVHAEATSEKVALGWFLDGSVSAVVGTHTHIPTADARLLEKGTAYITDVGMTGGYRGVIGRKREPILARFMDGIPRPSEVADEDVRLCGLEVSIGPDGRAESCRRIEEGKPGAEKRKG